MVHLACHYGHKASLATDRLTVFDVPVRQSMFTMNEEERGGLKAH